MTNLYLLNLCFQMDNAIVHKASLLNQTIHPLNLPRDTLVVLSRLVIQFDQHMVYVNQHLASRPLLLM